MSYIIKSSNPYVSVKLTTMGRELLAQGNLKFNHWAIGDSEINYNNSVSISPAILRPLDNQPTLKSFITKSDSVNPFQPITKSVINVVKATVNNKAKERGFFIKTTNYEADVNLSITSSSITKAQLNGTNIIPIVVPGIVVGDLMLLKVSLTPYSGATELKTTDSLTNLWFKIKKINPTSIELDRPTPNLTTVGSATSNALFYRGGEVTEIFNDIETAYWDSGTLSFNSNNNITCSDVAIWNMNNVWSENIAGIDTTIYDGFQKYGSQEFLGFKYPYSEILVNNIEETVVFGCNGPSVSYPDTYNKSMSIVHYTNKTISNLYGEFFYTDTENSKYLKINLPNLMYHRNVSTSGLTMGMEFIATGSTKFIEKTDIEYIDLIENPDLIGVGMIPKVVGRVFPQLKMFIFNDDEIVIATSYKSNRNWTLPSLKASVENSGDGILLPNETMYLSYILENTTNGVKTPINCQNYVKITNNTNTSKDILFNLEETGLLNYMRADGLGFNADTFKLVFQVVQDPNFRPLSNAWLEADFSSLIKTGGKIDPSKLENQSALTIGFKLLKATPTQPFNIGVKLNLPLLGNVNGDLQFGDERFFYGNLETYIGATIYKTIFDIRINSGQFNTSTNPTRSNSIATARANPLKISEIGIFDSNKNLVCIGKISNPVPLESGNTIMLELSMDF